MVALERSRSDTAGKRNGQDGRKHCPQQEKNPRSPRSARTRKCSVFAPVYSFKFIFSKGCWHWMIDSQATRPTPSFVRSAPWIPTRTCEVFEASNENKCMPITAHSVTTLPACLEVRMIRTEGVNCGTLLSWELIMAIPGSVQRD
jgi:hypothetical protein